MNDSFYMVWEASTNVTARYPTQTEALNSAKHLAQFPGSADKEYIVFRAVQSVTYRSTPFIFKNYAKDAIKDFGGE